MDDKFPFVGHFIVGLIIGVLIAGIAFFGITTNRVGDHFGPVDLLTTWQLGGSRLIIYWAGIGGFVGYLLLIYFNDIVRSGWPEPVGHYEGPIYHPQMPENPGWLYLTCDAATKAGGWAVWTFIQVSVVQIFVYFFLMMLQLSFIVDFFTQVLMPAFRLENGNVFQWFFFPLAGGVIGGIVGFFKGLQGDLSELYEPYDTTPPPDPPPPQESGGDGC